MENELEEALEKYFHHSKFKSSLQKDAIKTIVKRKQDVFISMPTGSGKSLCFQLPGMLHENKLTIVFSPLLALIKNQMDYLNSLKIPAESINSKMTSKERDRVLGDLKAKKMNTKFLYITPEQSQTASFQDLLRLLVRFEKVAYVAVDESHCLSAYGHDFRPDYLKLGSLRKLYPNIPWIALTATASKRVVKDIYKHLYLKEPVASFKTPCFRNNLFYDVVYKNMLDDDFIDLKAFIQKCLNASDDEDVKPKDKPCGIIYCRTRENTERVANCLSKLGLHTLAYHAGLKSKERIQVQEDWMSGKCPVISATVSFGMGVDKASVRFVIHWDVPQNVAAYYQESGRAGRDGKLSYCRVYYCKSEIKSMTFLLQKELNFSKNQSEAKQEKAKQSIKDLDLIVNYCESIKCRHLLFSEYFGDDPPKCRNMCDVCSNKQQVVKNLDRFQQLSVQGSLKTMMAYDADPAELYEGGKLVTQETFETYSNSDDDYGQSRREESAKRETKSLIEKQFAIRKAQAAKLLEDRPTAQISRVKSALSTEVKYNKSLTVKMRESHLKLIVDCLKDNHQNCVENNLELPKATFKYQDFEDVAKELEYQAFTNNKVVTLYRRAIVKEISSIKSLTKEDKLHPDLKNHVPVKKTPRGGDYETIVEQVKFKFGEDIVKSIEEDKEQKRIEEKAKQLNRNLQQVAANQPRIDSFFKVKEDSSSTDSNSNSVDSDLLKLELMKKKLKQELEEIREESEESEQGEAEMDIVESERLSSISPTLVIDDGSDDNEVSPKRKDSPETPISMKRKIDSPSKSPEKRFKSQAEVSAHKESPTKPTNDNQISSTSAEIKPLVYLDDAAQKLLQQKMRQHEMMKNNLSKIVVKFLMPFYKKNMIKGGKELFKAMARQITHNFIDQKHDDAIIEKYINEIFFRRGTISHEDDFMNFPYC